MLKHIFVDFRISNQLNDYLKVSNYKATELTEAYCLMDLRQGNDSLLELFWSHDQDVHHAHIC